MLVRERAERQARSSYLFGDWPSTGKPSPPGHWTDVAAEPIETAITINDPLKSDDCQYPYWAYVFHPTCADPSQSYEGAFLID